MQMEVVFSFMCTYTHTKKMNTSCGDHVKLGNSEEFKDKKEKVVLQLFQLHVIFFSLLSPTQSNDSNIFYASDRSI